MSKMHWSVGNTVAGVACGRTAAGTHVTNNPNEVTCGNCRRLLGKALGKAVARMAPNPAFPYSRSGSFVRERIPMRFRSAVVTITIRCEC